MKEKTCCFTGHRKLLQEEYEQIEKRLTHEILKLIKQGVTHFEAGGALGFDTLCAVTVIKLRKIYPHIKLILVIPCENQTKNWKCSDIETYLNIKKQADQIKVLSPFYYKGCMHVRNRYLVDQSRFCICYLRKAVGGTAYTIRYAKEKGLNIINL